MTINMDTGISALLRHEPFVRALARDLVGDRAAADDLTQETWLAALRRPPGAIGSAQAWLARVMRNLAHNERRARARRDAREREVSCAEADHRDEELRGRLELQHLVLTSLRELREPYQTVLLLRYYEGLSAAEIARRRGIPAGTVRAQLSRGLGELRSRLDARHPGGRQAWFGAAIALARRSPEGLAPFQAAAVAGFLIIAAAAVPFLMLSGSGVNPPPLDGLPAGGLASPEGVPRAGAATVAGPSVPDARPAAAVPVAEASPIERVELPPQDPSLKKKSAAELIGLAAQTQLLLRERLLTPEKRFDAERRALAALPDTGMTRLLERTRFEFELAEPLGIRGGGAYFSFHTQSHSYDDEPDLSLERGTFGTGFYGGTTGFVLALGDVALAELHAGGPPAALPRGKHEAWQHLWQEAGTTAAGFDAAFASRAGALGLSDSAPAAHRTTYLLRAILPGEHDHLVAVRSLAADDTGHTIAWRILARLGSWGEGTQAAATPARARPAKPPQWLARQDAEELLTTLKSIRQLGEARLLAVPESILRRHRGLVGKDGQGLCRILHRGKADAVITTRGGGAYYSFVTRSNGYDQEPDLQLSNGTFSSGFAGGDVGYLLDLGPVVVTRAHAMPAGLTDREREAWTLLSQMPSASVDGKKFELAAADRARASALGLAAGVPAVVGHTYLLRSVPSEHDVLVAFQVLAADESGMTLRWRVLARQ